MYVCLLFLSLVVNLYLTMHTHNFFLLWKGIHEYTVELMYLIATVALFEFLPYGLLISSTPVLFLFLSIPI